MSLKAASPYIKVQKDPRGMDYFACFYCSLALMEAHAMFYITVNRRRRGWSNLWSIPPNLLYENRMQAFEFFAYLAPADLNVGGLALIAQLWWGL